MLTFHSLSASPNIIVCCFLISSRFCPRLVRFRALRRVSVTSTVCTPICSRVFLTTRLTISGDNVFVTVNGAGIFECGNGDNGVDSDDSVECGNGVDVGSVDESVGGKEDWGWVTCRGTTPTAGPGCCKMLKRRDLRFRAVPYLEGMPVDTGLPPFKLAKGYVCAVIALGPFRDVTPLEWNIAGAGSASALFWPKFEWALSYAIFQIINNTCKNKAYLFQAFA